jgi:alpha/beta superfamily hydrolase
MLSDKLSIPGVHSEIIPGLVGDLEVIMEVPSNVDCRYLALLGHPHSLQGGTMQNKVVTTMARAFRELGIASIRFNFRGVGRSAGEYSAGVGESEDMLHLLNLCQCKDVTVFFAGFSFGSYVAFKALTQYQTDYSGSTALITIAPSVHHYDYSLPLRPQTPWLIVIGEEDEIVPITAVTDFAQQHVQQPDLECFSDTGHFFHGKLLDLKAVLQKYIRAWAGL